MRFPGFCMFSSAMLLLIILKSFPLRRVAMNILKEFSSIKLSAEAISHFTGVVAHVFQAEINNPRSNHSYRRHQWIHERADHGLLSSRFPGSAEISAGILSRPAAWRWLSGQWAPLALTWRLWEGGGIACSIPRPVHISSSSWSIQSCFLQPTSR